MIEVDIPDFGPLALKHLVLDYNGTLACDGLLLQGVTERINELADQLEVHVITADTFGKAREQLTQTRATLEILPPGNQAAAKEAFVVRLGASESACIGNGRNDRIMLKSAALGICVLEQEGASTVAMQAADVCTRSALSALDLLLHPKRLIAALRS